MIKRYLPHTYILFLAIIGILVLISHVSSDVVVINNVQQITDLYSSEPAHEPANVRVPSFTEADSEYSPQFTRIQWASTVFNTNVPTAGKVLGKPDGRIASFWDGNAATIETATYSGFGSGANVNYNSAALAALLGISETTLAQADFISFEDNGAPGTDPYETSIWVFNDGTATLTVSHNYNNPVISGPIVGLGNVSTSDYANFFGFTDPFKEGGIAYLLFDIDGNSDVNPFSPDFSATLNAVGSDTDGPDPDVMGRIGSIEVDLKIFNGGNDLDNGEEGPVQGAEILDEDEENVGAFLLVNWDDDDADGKMNDDGTWTKNPVPDLTENPVANEDNLAKLIPTITPLPEEGTAELHLVSGGNKIKLWSTSTKDSQVSLTAGKLSWDLSNPTERANFEKLGTDGLWIEGVKKSSEKEIKFTLKYLKEGNPVGDDTVVATSVMINLGNAVHREGDIPYMKKRGHAAIVYKFIGECNKEDLSDDKKFLIIETGPLRVRGDHSLETITGYSPWGCFTTGSVGYVDQLKILQAAKSLVGRIPWAMFHNALMPAKWDGKLTTIKRLRCDGLVEVCYEKNGIDVWGMERVPEGNKINYDIADQTDNWTYKNHRWWPRSNKWPDNLEEHNDFDGRGWEDTLMPATQCGKVKPVNAATKLTKQDLCSPIGSKGGN